MNTLRDFLELVESGLQDVIFLGAALVFLFTVENRIRRHRALRHLRELRALAHIVDMHQLSKDPDRLLQGGENTPSSPVRTLTRFQLGRYLDYASEILSLTGKVAALYAQSLSDGVVLQAVDEIEAFTTDLSGKIWQKIVILDTPLRKPEGDGAAPGLQAPVAPGPALGGAAGAPDGAAAPS